MSENSFDKLAPFIQEYIYRNKWENLRGFQAQAIEAILGASDHVLISSGTASGKTEAALLPIITDLYRNPPLSIGAMYIGPLKALINDQFERIVDLLKESDIPAQSWHGDVSSAKKRRFLKRARGILQITPESLESMLINRQHELKRLFFDLRYVIIDEVHAFIVSDRGRQALCQLERLSRVQSRPSRRIGLSATIGEPQLTMDWLKGYSKRGVKLIEAAPRSNAEIGLEYFRLRQDYDNEPKDSTPVNALSKVDSLDALTVDESAYYQHAHQMTQRQGVGKTLIFANARQDTEAIAMNLRQLSERRRLPAFYHVHHGSISAPLRESAEAAMKAENQKACVAATVTLELGIDLGQLDQVLQINSTHSVSSFVQRLGRSGRRGGPARMFFYATERESEPRHLGEELPWNLLQTIAIIQLYAEEKWIEPPQIPQMPLSLLYHQTMSIIKSHTELSPSQLAERVLTLSPFKRITEENFRQLLHYLLEIEHLERTEKGGLIIGIEAENIVSSYRFYATFKDEVEYRVRDKSREIGALPSAPPVNSAIALAGYAWRVLKVDEEMRVIEVERARGRPDTLWRGEGPPIHTRILQKMRDILLSHDSYPYLQPRARKRLDIARQSAQSACLGDASIFPLTESRCLVFPWRGTAPFETQRLLLEYAGFKVPGGWSPYYYALDCGAADMREVKCRLEQLYRQPPSALDLANRVDVGELRQRNKYDVYVPEHLLRAAYACDFIDIPAALRQGEGIRAFLDMPNALVKNG